MITNNGKTIALRYLAGVQPSFVNEIAVGIGNGAESASDTRMNFEVGRFSVNGSTISGTAEEIVFQGSAPINDTYKIYEIGVFPKSTTVAGTNVDSLLIATFDTGDGTTFESPDALGDPSAIITDSDFRIGTTGAYLQPDGGRLDTPMAGDFSRFNLSDQINCAFITETDDFDFDVRLIDSSGSYTTLNFSGNNISNGTTNISDGERIIVTSGSGTEKYVIYYKPFTSITSNFSSLTSMAIINNHSTWLKFDGVRIEDGETINPLNSLISRTVAATPRQKEVGFTVDVEYRMALEF